MRRILHSIGIVGLILGAVFVVGSMFAPSASALTVDEIQTQIRELLAKVGELTKQLNILQGQSTVTPDPADWSHSDVPRPPICMLSRNLSQGMRGDDVLYLQKFLQSEQYLAANPTGYFGPMTAQAVAKWQASQGVSAVGSFGPMSRERVKVWCGTADRFSAAPQRGLAPLTVNFIAHVSYNSEITYDIDFGDGSSDFMVREVCDGGRAALGCTGEPYRSHTYTSNGTYTAVLYQTNRGGCSPEAEAQGCLGPPASHTAIAKLQIHVGDSVACTKEYIPVCGSKPIVCITTPCNPIQQTYGNRCTMEADGAKFLYEGACKGTGGPVCGIPPGRGGSCTNDMCITTVVYRGEPVTYATRMELDQTNAKYLYDGVCRDTDNKPPVISSFSGPTSLAVNASGTWTIKASDPENGYLVYTITWGDEKPPIYPQRTEAYDGPVQQISTFTHTYSSAGTYTVTIVVRDSAGKEAKASSTVRVGKEPVACTADAMQCPDGSWVGRTGPNCQFTCPNSIAVIEQGTQCTTPWGNQIFASGNQVSYQPYFSNGQYTYSAAVPKMFCSMGKWLKCDYQGNNCAAY